MPFLKTESYRKGVLFSTALNAISKGSTFLSTLLVAHYFGSNAGTDLYFAVIAIALMFTTTINGIDYLIIVPEAMRLRVQVSEAASQRFSNFFVYAYALIGLAIALVVAVAPTTFYAAFTSFDQNTLGSFGAVLYLSGLIISLQLVNMLLSAILSSYKYFSAPTLINLFNAGFAILLTIVFRDRLGIQATVLGLALGGIVNLLMLVGVMVVKQNWNFANFGLMRDSAVWKNIGLMQVNTLPLWLRNAIGLFLISSLATGTLTSLNLGQQLAGIPDVLILTQLLSVSGIKFSELFANSDHAGANRLFLFLSEWGISFTIFAASILLLYSDTIVRIVYSFSKVPESSLADIRLSFAFFVLAMPVKFMSGLCGSVFTASQNIRSIFAISVVTHLFATVSMIGLIVNFGLIGYLSGITLHLYVFFVLFYFMFRKVLPQIDYSAVFALTLKNLFINSLAFGAVWFLWNMSPGTQLAPLEQLIAGAVLYAVIAIVGNQIVKGNRFATIANLRLYAYDKFSA